ncbi:MAG: hypothetical protein Q4B70_12605 [Lachnospiraceae bacterium]|nr:hypothetical protein [Lachnospiraceae bacterium]
MIILDKTLSEKTENIYNEIAGKLNAPVSISKMDTANPEEAAKPCYYDGRSKEYVIKLDTELEADLFENALIRNMIYCLQMAEGSPMLEPNPNDYDAVNVAAMINSVILDINLEMRLKGYEVSLDEIDNMRMGDLFMFLRSDMSETNRDLYNKMASLQVVLLYYTAEKKENVEQIMETFELSDPVLYEYIAKCIDIIDKYGCDTARGQMRCMRKIALAMDMKDKMKIFYEEKATLI